ncbi:MAG: ATP-binding cassette domain-containing protein [Gemmatimonadales bacterium]|nr:MAG: ATP-binding cassette domain-containing protein [Gemmatimonadales bacterium]
MIRLEGVSKGFGGSSVLSGLDLVVPTGSMLAVIGRSGTGKSVLLKCIARLLNVDSGCVEVGGEDVGRADSHAVRRIRSRIGYVFQFAALFDSMTIGENVEAPLRREGVPPGEAMRRADDVLARVGLAGIRNQLPAELSGGMRKRVGIARAVVAEPEYLLYDEPTTGLDPVTTGVIDELILGLKRDLGATGIVVTHDIRSALRVADRIALLHEGRLHVEGTPEEIRNSDDPLIRAFVEGKSELWPEESGFRR